MPPPNIFTRATRIFQNAAQPAQSQNQQPNPTDSANHSQYETDGSSYEMLVVESPTRSHRQHAEQTSAAQNQPTADEPPPTPRRRQSTRRQTKSQNLNSKKPPSQPQAGSQKTQTEPRTPPPQTLKEPRTPEQFRTPEEPQTPSQRLPTALRRIDATPIDLGKSSGYNLRSRTRSQGPATPQRLRTPARSRGPQRQKNPARSRTRELRQAPSARTTSGVAGRPAIVSRCQIDESSYVTLRAMCRNFGLPTTGTKADLRARALEQFETRDVLEEHNQPMERELKQSDDSNIAHASEEGPISRTPAMAKNEENSGQVPVAQEKQPEEQGEREEKDVGKQLTTSTVKPAGTANELPVEATIAAKSDEPSVHAKSDMPEKDPRRAVNTAQCSVANSPVHPVAPQAPKFAQPTVSSTGAATRFPDSPRPPTGHPTPRLSDPSFHHTNKNRREGPTESVDARGGDLDVAAIFQELASGRRKLSQAEYETVLKSIKEKAPDRPQPLQIPINAARVSLNSLPNTPFPVLKLPITRALPNAGGAPLEGKTIICPQNQTVGASDLPPSSGPKSSKPPAADALEKSDNNKRSAQKDTKTVTPPEVTETVVNVSSKVATSFDKSMAVDAVCDDLGERCIANSNRNEHMPRAEREQVSQAQEVVQSSSKVEPIASKDRPDPESVPIPKSVPNMMNQSSLPAILAGAHGGPHEGNFVDKRERAPAIQSELIAAERGGCQKTLSEDRTERGKNSAGPRQAIRSGFATPRELVRRFNRFREGDLTVEDNLAAKPDDSGDPANSLIRRNARRSSSGVPLFYSARGPSTAGRSIAKTRTASKAREAQNHLRRVDRLRNLSGRSSFRVKRPLSASAGALLVDLRRISGTNRSSTERVGQPGSYQAEIARRPPPMPASALKILKELEQIQESNPAYMNMKRNISPPPLPPSVVKRARRSGQFSKGGNEAAGRRFSIFEQDEVERHSKRTSGSLSESKPTESPPSTVRLTPKIPPIAYGAGKRRIKRSRNEIPPEITPIPNMPEKEFAVSAEARNDSSSPPRTRKKRHQKNKMNATADQSIDKSTPASSLVIPSKIDAETKLHSSNATEAEHHGSSAVPLFEGKLPGNTPLKFSQPPSDEGLGTAKPVASLFGTVVEDLKTSRSTELGGKQQGFEDVQAVKPTQSFSARPVVDQAQWSNPSSTPPAITGGQHVEHSKGFPPFSSTKIPIETGKEGATPVQEKAVLGSTAFPWSTAGTAPAGDDSVSPSTAENTDKPDALSHPTLSKNSPFAAETTNHSEKSGQEASKPSSAPSFPSIVPPGNSLFATSSSAFVFSKPSVHTDGKDQSTECEQTEAVRPATGLSQHGSASPFGSFGGMKGASGLASAPPKSEDHVGSAAKSSFGLPPFATPAKELGKTKEQRQTSIEASGHLSGPETLPPIPVATPVSFGTGAVEIPISGQKDQKETTGDPSNLFGRPSDVTVKPPAPNPFGVQPENKVSGLPSAEVAALTGIPVSANAEPQHVPLATNTTVTAATPRSSKVAETESANTSSQNKGETLGASNETHASLFGSAPFTKPLEESKPQPAFSFSSAPKALDGTPSGPFTDPKFNTAFSSGSSSNTFAFRSSTGATSAVTPAPSFGGLGESAAGDKAKQNLFAQPSNPTPFTFGSQPSNGSRGMTESSGPGFGLPSGSGPLTTFSQSTANTTPAFGSSFGSAPPLFNTGAGNSFAAGSTTPAFGAPTNSSTPPLFGNVNIPSTPFGSSSGTAIAPSFGAANTGPLAPSMFEAASGGSSAPGFGGASTSSFAFGNSNVSTFGANSTQQPNPFDQSGNAAQTSGGVFGAGGFNMGSATRPPQSQRRRLRGRRTLR